MSNIVIIGSGPAGVSAALYTARAGVDTTVLTRGPGASPVPSWSGRASRGPRRWASSSSPPKPWA